MLAYLGRTQDEAGTAPAARRVVAYAAYEATVARVAQKIKAEVLVPLFGNRAGIPAELGVFMLQFLSAKDLGNLAQVSTELKEVVDHVCEEQLRCVLALDGESEIQSLPIAAHFLERPRGFGVPSVTRLLHILCNSRQETYATTLTCGEGHTCVIQGNGSTLFTFGDGNSGQLGSGERERSVLPVRLSAPFGETFVGVACGAEHTSALTSSGRILTCGANLAGQLGRLTENNEPSATLAQLDLCDARFVQVVAGRFYTAAITTDGRVAIFGTGLDCELVADTCLLVAGDIDADERIVQLAAGAGHLLLLSNQNRLFALGDGTDGKLGLEANLAGGAAARNDFEREQSLHASSTAPRLVAMPESALSEDIVHIAAGGRHSGFIAASGALYMWGSCRHGELGIGRFQRAIFQPTKVRLPASNPFALAMSCGTAHTAVLTTGGRVVTFGNGSHNQDGKQNSFWATNAPHEICPGEMADLKPELVHVVCGGRHSAALDVRGRLFTFGDPLCCGRPLRLAMAGPHFMPRQVNLIPEVHRHNSV
ncbi:Secretion-regulating guanine nucleotide exchange factor [Hondaea fermentalgiana]|uniref:Secretion-regulating guanine nucleotide exchange factor n=1 Tax=Hondaea fermentalgiana TaxID=2315210 RepID=A0A2R5G6L1_9STRA|nr:Secretion-regulating guanine nucleotide exchange factor [Hondaea fermentalgiana]|eukprot:GBG26165.1 Secretion-regulating guanine nucleotide exchange factor [Hondaea fermentalgiana]